MKHSWQIGRIGGIVVRVHVTFPLLLLWVAFIQIQQGGGVFDFLRDTAFVLVVFAIIVLHEFGHARTARHYGIGTHDITLLPIGGVARLERMPEKPSQELAVALAGPAVNVVLAAFFWVLWLIFIGRSEGGTLIPPVSLQWVPSLSSFFWVNVFLVAFNMLPAFPMDGGRVLRALLAMRLGSVRATDAAAAIGRGMAMLFGLLGLAFSYFLILIAIFVWMGAGAEAGATHLRAAVRGLPVRRLMWATSEMLPPGLSLSEAMDRMIAGGGRILAVGDNGTPTGLVGASDLLNGLMRRGGSGSVESVMRRKFASVDVGDEAREAIRKLEEAETDSLPVLEEGRLVGFLSRDNVARYVAFHNALTGSAASRPQEPPLLRSS